MVAYTLVQCQPGRTHKIRATECGKARADDTFTALWTSTTCPECLAKRPLRRVAAVAAPVPERRPDPRARPPGPFMCREGCGSPGTCMCGRCDAHCLAKAPGDKAAHDHFWATWKPDVKVKRRRNR
jgi:hypothetical protein